MNDKAKEELDALLRKAPYEKGLLLSLADYRKKYKRQLQQRRLLDYFGSGEPSPEPGVTRWMLKFPRGEHVPGCAWPGNYGTATITDFRSAWAPGELPFTAENIAREAERKRRSLYEMPGRLQEQFKTRLLVEINGQVCQNSSLSDEMLAEMEELMTPFERSDRQQALHRIDVALYPSVEQPVELRLDGCDDGAEAKLYPDVASALAELESIARWDNRESSRRYRGFRHTD